MTSKPKSDFPSWVHPQAAESVWWWDYARATASRLQCGLELQQVTVPGLCLGRDEIGYAYGDARYARYHAGDGSFAQTSVLAVGSAPFVVGSVAGVAISNARRRRAAERRAAVQWQEYGTVSVLCTNSALRCYLPWSGLLELPWPIVSEFHPDPRNWALTLRIGSGGITPLRLTGLVIPTITVLAAHYLGQDLHDERLAPLVEGSPLRLDRQH